MKTKITVLALLLSIGMTAMAADSPLVFGKKRKKEKTEKSCSEESKKSCKTEAEKGASCCAKKS